MDREHPTRVAPEQCSQRAAASLFGAVTDPIRAASRIVHARALTPEAIRETCNLGFARIFRSGYQED
jgi:hypothetical protein